MTEQERLDTIRELLVLLAGECKSYGPFSPAELERAAKDPAATFDQLWYLYRSTVNTRPAQPAPAGFLELEDALLADFASDPVTVGETEQSPVDPRLRLWRGDITKLATDAIVNAANKYMTGCWVPMHLCIDNAIHTFAGVCLRAECERLMVEQGEVEPTGRAKVTSAYNLPSTWVIHTVGPIVRAGRVTEKKREELASCYASCLDAAAGVGAKSMAFCCISTGVFGYPQERAVGVALDTVVSWLDAHPETEMTVVFNVFLERDERLYRKALGL